MVRNRGGYYKRSLMLDSNDGSPEPPTSKSQRPGDVGLKLEAVEQAFLHSGLQSVVTRGRSILHLDDLVKVWVSEALTAEGRIGGIVSWTRIDRRCLVIRPGRPRTPGATRIAYQSFARATGSSFA